MASTPKGAPSGFFISRDVMVPLAAAILALGGAWVGAYFGLIGKERELDIRMVEISLSILKGENKGTETEQARRFALRALEHYSKIDIPKDEFEKWVATGTIEFGKVPSYVDSIDYRGGWNPIPFDIKFPTSAQLPPLTVALPDEPKPLALQKPVGD